MDDPVAATRLMQAQHVDRVLKHEREKARTAGSAQDAALSQAADDLKARMK